MTDILQHENGLPMVLDSTGAYRVLAALPPAAVPQFPSFEGLYGVLPQSEWVEGEVASWIETPIMDQGKTSECVGEASAVAFFKAWAEAGGQAPAKPFSGGWIYSFINGGRDAGAMVSDGGKALMQHGICTQAEGPEGDIFPRQFPPEAATVAAGYKALSVVQIGSVAQLGSAATLKKPCVAGILVGRAFMQGQPDEEGVLPVDPMSGIIGGHAVPIIALAKSAKYGWKFLIQNSWTSKWGIQGRGYLQPGHFSAQMDAYCIDSIVQQ